MTGAITFDIFFLGLKDPSADGRARFSATMQRLTGAPAHGVEAAMSQPAQPLFSSLERETALSVVDHLEQAGVRIEIRPNTGAQASQAPQPPAAGPAQAAPPLPSPADQAPPPATPPPAPAVPAAPAAQAMPMPGAPMAMPGGPGFTCPACGHEQPAGLEDCQRCGLVFAKFEREKLEQERRDQRLDEALAKQAESRSEWTQRAKHFLESHPLDESKLSAFSRSVDNEEIPFLVLIADEGPLLMTSRRLLLQRDSKTLSIPYELINDVDLGGGFVQRKNRERFQLSFHSELPLATGPAKNLVWFLEKESAFFKDVVMDWVFARSFACGSCGAPDLDYRVEKGRLHTRCMHCATDHEIRLDQAVALPIFHD